MTTAEMDNLQTAGERRHEDEATAQHQRRDSDWRLP